MRCRLNHLLQTLFLSACAGPLSQPSLGQEPGLIQYATSPRWGEVQTVSGSREGRAAPSSTAPVTALAIANSGPQPPVVPQPPATGGPIQLPGRASSPSDNPSAVSSQSTYPGGPKLDAATAQPPADENGAVNRSENALTPLQNRELSIPVQVVDLSVAGLGTGTFPDSASALRDKLPFEGRGAAFKCVHWHPSSICHYPLRFEEPMLERHGHVRFGCWQPLVSGVKFFTTIPMIPYYYTLQPTHQPVYALGNYRPGSCAPMLRETIPYDRQAVVAEALVLGGFFWAMPL